MNDEQGELEEKGSFWGRVGRKPLPVQRILAENGPVKVKGVGKQASPSISPGDKENQLCDISRVLTSSTETTVDTSDQADWALEPLSSTLAVSSSDNLGQAFSDHPGQVRFSHSASNLSSISLQQTPSLLLEAGVTSDKIFKTPKRREAEAQLLGQSPHRFQQTPTGPRTPGSGAGSRTPSSGASQRRTPCSSRTPSSSSSSTRWNPFDSHNSCDALHQPTLSPNVFATVISPSQDTEASTGRFWSIEQQADMFPTAISDDSPLKQSIYVKHHNKDLENKTQEQIELYFKEHHAITSPPDLPPTGPLLVDSPKELSYSQDRRVASTWCQTVLTFPPNLPPHVEQVLKQFCTFQDPLGPGQVSFSEEMNNLSNSTLRRKLFNGDMLSEEEEDDGNSCSSRSPSPSPPVTPLTPGKVIHTPVTTRNTVAGQWSSSPVRRVGGRATSFSPPDQMGSPMFSPIVKDKQSRRERRTEDMVEMRTEVEEVNSSYTEQGSSQESEHGMAGDLSQLDQVEGGDLSGELYKTAEIDCSQAVQMEVDNNSCLGWPVSTVSRSREGWDPASASPCREGWDPTSASCSKEGDGWAASTAAASHIGDTWAVSVTLPDDTEGGSRVDTGYNTNTTSSTGLVGSLASPTPPSYSTSTQDSGVQVQEQTGGVSSLGPAVRQEQQQVNNGVLMSYGVADNTNDISVGFPLGSSTPTKK